MAIDPRVPPPLPSEVQGRPVQRVDGSETFAVTVRDAARLIAKSEESIRESISTGKVDICTDGGITYVLIDSLWLLVPEEERRA